MGKKSNPVLNGSTKKIILGVTIMIGLITTISLIGLIVILMEDDPNALHMLALKSSLGSITLTGLGALTRMTHKFMDTRNNQEKDNAKQKRIEEKNRHKEKMKSSNLNYKLEKHRWNLKQDEKLLHIENEIKKAQ